jgi:pyridoxine kinase
MVGEEYKEGPYEEAYIISLVKKVAALGPKQVVLTGVFFDDKKLGAAVYDSLRDSVEYVFNPFVDGYFHGTGDTYGSALLSALLCGKTLAQAAQIACDFVYKAICITMDLKQEIRYGVAFELALPFLMEELGLL